MAARLRFQQQREGRIALDVDPLDRIHLHRDIQRHAIARRAVMRSEEKENRALTYYRHYAREGIGTGAWR